ncbi:MAG TPA: 30S ribosomal protein S6 [Vicinamibacterales bacterium]|nr:30S ribosomal protein S6 [Vicinamibacterales bacterium]
MSTRKYELVYVVSPEVSDDQVSALHDQVQSIVDRYNGRIERTENWGRRKLAYEIDHHKEGTYVLEVIEGSGELVKELDRRLKVLDEIIRHLIVRVDEEQRVVERLRSRRQEAVARRRAARGLPPDDAPQTPSELRDDDDEDRFEEAGVEA